MDTMEKSLALLSGATFGAALTASGVWSPSTIVDQMHLQDFRMLKVFLTASGASAYVFIPHSKPRIHQWTYANTSESRLILHLLPQTSSAKCARPPSTLGILGRYDGNVIGGAMVGIGMTLTGACPGTVLVQIASGTYPGRYSFIGGLGGGILYVALRRLLRRSTTLAAPKASMTLYEQYNINPDAAILGYVVLCATVVTGLIRFIPETDAPSAFLSPVLGGLIIGAAQLTSVVLRRAPVGISTAYEELGTQFWDVLRRTGLSNNGTKESADASKKPTLQATYFAGGVVLGTLALTLLAPKFLVESVVPSINISPLRAAAGGLTMVLGARIANGCTSGHGISGMSLLAKSSIVTVMSMFIGGMGLAQVMRFLGENQHFL